MIKGIIFDKDGTLFDFNATWGVWTRTMLAAEAGGDPDVLHALADVLGYDIARQVFRPGSVVIASTGDIVADHIMQVLPNLSKQELLARMRAGAVAVTQVEAVPLAAFFADLTETGLKLGLVTNDDETTARRHLDAARIRHHFDFIAGYDSGHGAKPEPGQLHAFCAQIGIAPQACVMVGDSLHDLHAGRSAGMITVGVLSGPAPATELAPHAHVVLQTIAEIPGWLRAENLI